MFAYVLNDTLSSKCNFEKGVLFYENCDCGWNWFCGKSFYQASTGKRSQYFCLNSESIFRKNGIHYVQWLQDESLPIEALEGADAFVNLAGVSLNTGRWTKKQKKDIYWSRMHATLEIVRIMAELTKKPKVLVNASAIGFTPILQRLFMMKHLLMRRTIF